MRTSWKIFGEVSSLVGEKGFISVHDLLESKTFRRSFGLPEPVASRNAGEDRLVDDAPPPPHRATQVSSAIPEMNCAEVAPLEKTH